MFFLFSRYPELMCPSQALTQALYNLTTYPEHILPIQEEAERVIREEGWTKPALNSMHKINSFLRESWRRYWNGTDTHFSILNRYLTLTSF